jgi:hypothetical protein
MEIINFSRDRMAIFPKIMSQAVLGKILTNFDVFCALITLKLNFEPKFKVWKLPEKLFFYFAKTKKKKLWSTEDLISRPPKYKTRVLPKK